MIRSAASDETEMNEQLFPSREWMEKLRSSLSGSEGPIYYCLSAFLKDEIRSGRLGVGSQLPPLRDMARELELSKGTIKHAYHILAEEGLLQLTQGRGSFVTVPREEDEALSRKDRAMEAIDGMIDRLNFLHFTQREMQIFVDLKLREREEGKERVRVGVAVDSPEARMIYLSAFASLPEAELYAYPVEEILDGAVPTDNLDLLLSSEKYYRELELLPTQTVRVQLIGLSLDPATAVALANLSEDSRLAVLSLSKTYSGIMREACSRYANLHRRPLMGLFSDSSLGALLEQADSLLLPEGYLGLVQAETDLIIRKFSERQGRLILFREQCERGSFLSVRDRVLRISEKKRAQRESGQIQ